MSLKKPTWKQYKFDTVLELRAAVALAMNVDPDAIRAAQERDGAEKPAAPTHSQVVRYRTRLPDAVDAMRMFDPQARAADADSHYQVRLVDFAWVVLLGLEWTLPPEFPRFKPIDWKVWRHIPHAKLWQVVAASVGISPDFLPEDRRFSLELAEKWGFPDDFLKRFRIAEANFGGALPLVPAPTSVQADEYWPAMIRLADFARFAMAAGWEDLPDEFPRPTVDATRTGGKWPWGNYETELLQHLAAAVQQFWTKYDPSKPQTAPTNEKVAKWLESRGVSAIRVREIIAQIIRSDRAPRGARPTPGGSSE
jgi:hypothetical protein